MRRPGSLVPALVYVAVALTPLSASGQAVPAGVVTALQGQATVVRTAATEPGPLKFKDDVFVRDRIRTGDQALVRILLGGRATVTVREHSVLTITEQPGVSQINVGAGRAAIYAVKSRMKPGETIDIVTPTGVATIRGTVVVAEVTAGSSTFTVLRGLVDVRQLDPGTQRPVGAVLQLGPLQRVTLAAGAPPKAQTLTPETGQQVGNQFKVGPRETPAGVHEAMTETQVRTAVEHLSQLSALPGAAAKTDASPSASIATREPSTGTIAVAIPTATAPTLTTTTTLTTTATTLTTTATTLPATLTTTATTTLTGATSPLLSTTSSTVQTTSTLLDSKLLTTLSGQVLTAPSVPTSPLTTTGQDLLGTIVK